MKKQYKTHRSNWYEYTNGWSGLHLSYDLAGYDDPRPVLMIYFIWGKLFLFIPWWKHYKKVELDSEEENVNNNRKVILDDILDNKKTVIKKRFKKVLYDDSDPPSYGIYFCENTFCIKHGEKTKMIDLPWRLDWVRTSALRKDGEWEHDYCKSFKKKKKYSAIHPTRITFGNRIVESGNFWDTDIWGDTLYYETHPYSYTTKYGEVQNCIATIRVQEMEWRWTWFKWLKWTRHISKRIEIDFSDDIGEKKGSWKGGTVGCDYRMLPNETPTECLKRMERERKF